MAYSDLAPTCDSVGATQEELQTILDNKPLQLVQGPDPTITKAHIISIANKVCNGNSISEQGGIVVISHEEGLTTDQVKMITKELCDVFSSMESGQL